MRARWSGERPAPLFSRLAAPGSPAEGLGDASRQGAWHARWERQRYRTLLELAARSRTAGAAYAEIVAALEWHGDPHRRDVAVRRIGRWLGVGEIEARRIYRSALRSEAREEADARFLMDHPEALAGAFLSPPDEPDLGGPAIWLTLHLGSPVLAFVYLRQLRGLDVRIIGRPLDDANPMHPDKRGFGRRKVRWLEELTGAPFLDTSAEAAAIARSHLVHGGALFALMDTPGDIVARSITLELFGARVRVGAGIFRLAALAGAPVRPIVAVRRGRGFELAYGRRIDPISGRISSEGIARELSCLIRRFPEEWWFWPFLPEAP